ncbi:AAA family ATPase [Streptomyces halstedii]|uniref:AAA family ATPase n=1 Tax=Streptomyces halstedii TaxID=1944 RepID=UPI0038172909
MAYENQVGARVEGRLWPDRLVVGDRVRRNGAAYTISAVCGRQVTLTDDVGRAREADILELLFAPDFAVLESGSGSRRVACDSDADGTPVERSLWWESHILEVLTGLPADAAPDARPRPDFDPVSHSLAEREQAKARELAGMGVPGASARTVRRKRQRYQAQGPTGLIDGRAGRREAPGARLDPRIVEAVRDIVLTPAMGRLPGSERVRAEVLRRLAGPLGRGELSAPSRSAIHRLRTELTREPSAPGTGSDSVPQVGERVHLDTVHLSVPVHDGHGARGGLGVLFAVDEATRLILTAVVFADKRVPSVGPALLARMGVPQDQRDRWAGLVSPDRARGAGDASGSGPGERAPLIRPSAIVVDSAIWPGLTALRVCCGRLGIHVRQTSRTLPGRRGVERSLARAASLFTDHLLTFAPHASGTSSRSAEEVQELLDAWVARVWPYADDPVAASSPDAHRTPMGRYECLAASAHWTPTPLSPEEFAELLDVAARVVGPSGVHLAGRTYDAPALDPLRSTRPVGATDGRRVSVRWDPYDLRRVWVEGPDGQWLEAPLVPSTSSVLRDALGHNRWQQTVAYTEQPASPAPGRPASLRAITVEEAAGAPPSPPIGSGSVTQSDAARITYHAQLPLHVPAVAAAVRRIDEAVLLNRASLGSRHGVLLHGPSGSGKTIALRWAASHHLQFRRAECPPAEGRRPAIHVRLAPATSPRQLLTELARSLGAPLRGTPTTSDLAHHVSQALEETRTSLILVDEAHHLHGPGWSKAAVADTLDFLCDRVPATFVYAALDAPDLLASSLTSLPHRRLLPVRLADLPEDEGWTQLLHNAEQALQLSAHPPGMLSALSRTLHRRTGGNVGRLAYLLRAAAVRAIQDGTEELTGSLLSELPVPGSGFEPHAQS